MRKVTMLAAALAAAASLLPAALTGPFAGSASATTGDTYVLPPSQYVIPPQVMGQFFGDYQLTSVGKGSGLTAANIFISTNAFGDLYGGGDFYGYDNTGTPTDWTNLLYDFQFMNSRGALLALPPWTTASQVAGDSFVTTLYGWGSPSLGTMTLHKQPGGYLAGTIRLLGQTRSYPIRFQRTGNVTAPD